MASNKKSSKKRFLNALIFSGILLTNIINPNKGIALTQENMISLKLFLTDQHHVVVAKNGLII